MAGKKNTTSKDKCCAPSTSAGEEEIDVKKDLRDILRCGACELIFFNLDDFVAHKSEDCQASKVKSSYDSDVEVIRHSPNPPVSNGEDQHGAYRDPHVPVQREGSRHSQPRHVPAPGRRKDDQETQSDSRRVPAQSSFGAKSCRIDSFLGSTSNCNNSASDISNPEPLDVAVKLYRTGYTVDDGPVREYNDPQNREFLASIFERKIPAEFQYKRNRNIYINLTDYSSEEHSDEKKFLEYLVGNRFQLRNTMKVSSSESEDSKKGEFRWKIHMKHDSSFDKIRKIKEKEEKEKPPVITKRNEKSGKLWETGVKSGKSKKEWKNDQDDNEMENDRQKIFFENKERSLSRAKGKISVEIRKEKAKLAAIQLEREETALKMAKEKSRSAEIKLHNERQELNVQQGINDLEESIKRR